MSVPIRSAIVSGMIEQHGPTKGHDLRVNRGKRAGRGWARASTMAAMFASTAVLTATLAPPAGAIIGGQDATEEYSFIVTLRDQNDVHYCGGALVAPDWVVTAGHCSHVPTEKLTVKVGGNDVDEGGSVRAVEKVVRHPDYTADPLDLRHDLALLKLAEPVDHAPIAIAATSGTPGTEVRQLGWGMTCEMGNECPEPPATLQELDTEIVSDDRCTAIDAAGDLCSEHPTEQAQSCVLDSGSPMVRKNEGRWELVGVTSRDGNEMTDPNCVGPGVWTDTAAYGDWIRTTAGIEAEPSTPGLLSKLLTLVFGGK